MHRLAAFLITTASFAPDLIAQVRRNPTSPVSEYVDSRTCAACHAEIAKKYALTSMAKSVSPAGAASTVEVAPALFEHSLSSRKYDIQSKAGQIVQRRTFTLTGDVYEQTGTHVVGSGKNARSYLHRAGSGELSQLPLSWYSQSHQWSMSPGYDAPKHFDFSRQVDPGCLFCHTAYPTRMEVVPSLTGGIDCQRCHGPGSKHIGTGGSVKTIVNPAKLESSRRLDVCLQCHLQSTSDPLPHMVLRTDRNLFSFRPGESLSDYAVHLDRPSHSGEQRVEVNSHGYRLLASKCFLQTSGSIQCTSCHNPHGEVSTSAVRERTQAQCLSCHKPHETFAKESCDSCHMPRVVARDAPLVQVTDHRIQKPAKEHLRVKASEGPYKGELLLYRSQGLRFAEEQLYLGIAYVEGGADRHKGLALLQAYPDRLPVSAVRALATGLDKTGNLAGALPVYLRLTRSAEDLALQADALQRSGRTNDAEARFELALPLPQAHLGLAALLLSAGRPDLALEHWMKAASSVKTRSEALSNLGA
ncbi:MAG: hypothetical protein H7039_19075, partial [Bryobacteraceae bacterium]|nr:hypothetical protein [Bryobacteraceae bacterium]